MEKRFLVTASPHIGTSLSAKRIMLIVILCLMPALLAGAINFGVYAVIVVAVSVTASVLAEWVFCKIYKKPSTVGDLSAVVTGLILGLNMPPAVPLYIPAIGGIFAIIIVKMLFGGLGKNFANPAAAGRVFLLLSFGAQMTSYVAPKVYGQSFMTGFFSFSATTSATPLRGIGESAVRGLRPSVNLLDLFFGATAGSIGEVSALAILIGGLALILFKVVNFRKPLYFLLSVAVFTLFFYHDGIYFVLPMLLSGGVMLAGFFMITDYSSGPATPAGAIIYSAGIGLFTVLIRRFGSFPEGVSIAILLMNCITPTLDKYLIPKPFGYVRPKKPAKTKEGTV